jgi:xylulokinase
VSGGARGAGPAGEAGAAATPAGVVLAIDLGTGGPKVALVGLDGRVRDHEHRRVPTTMVGDGGATQEADDWWAAVLDGAAALRGRGRVTPAEVVAVAVTGQWGSTLPVDDEGRPVGPCRLWFDRRGRDLAAAAVGGRVPVVGYDPRKALTWLRVAGGAPSPEGNDPLGHRLHMAARDAALDRRTATFVEPIDHVVARCCGRVAASPVSMLLWWLTDHRHDRDDPVYDPRLARLAHVAEDRLPPLVPTRSVVGGVLPEVAGRLGVPAGTPVVTALPDLHSTAIGSGAVADGAAHVSISTSSWVGVHVPFQRTSLLRQMATVPSALPDRYILANNHETAGVALEWLRDHVVAPHDGLTSGRPSLGHLDEVAAGVPPGSGGLVFTPWLNGERSPVSDTDLRGSLHGLSLSTDRAHVVRAVLEGVAHNARWLYEASERVVRRSLGEPRLVGGGSMSDLWCQIHADVLGRAVHRVEDPLLAGVRGAALFAGSVLGHLTVEDLAVLPRVERTFRPDPAARHVHDVVHREFVRLARTEGRLGRRLRRAGIR